MSFLPSHKYYTHTHTHTIFQVVFVIKPLHIYIIVSWASLVAQMVKNLLARQEVWSLGQEDPLEKEMATHSCILTWRIPWTEEPGGLQSMGSQRVRHDFTFTFHCILWYKTIRNPFSFPLLMCFGGSVHLDWCRSDAFCSWMSRLLHTLLSLLSCPHTHGLWSRSTTCFSMNFWAMN